MPDGFDAIPKAVGGVINTILGGGQKDSAPPPPPAPAPVPVEVKQPTTMPTSDDDTIQKAKRAAALKQSQRQGRASTILTSDSSDTLG